MTKKLITLITLSIAAKASAAVFVAGSLGVDFAEGIANSDQATFNFFDSSAAIADGASVALSGLSLTDGTLTTATGFTFTNNSGQETNPLAGNFTDAILSNNTVDRPLDPVGVANFELLFTGLEAGGTYTFEGGFLGPNANFNTSIESAGVTPVATTTTSFATLSGLVADTDGNLIVSVVRDPLQLTLDEFTLTGNFEVVPEPSSSMLLGLGGLALLSRRKRK